jgi:hypothetical protein
MIQLAVDSISDVHSTVGLAKIAQGPEAEWIYRSEEPEKLALGYLGRMKVRAYR